MLIKFPYNKELIEDIKTIPGRKYNPDEKGWGVPDRFLPIASEMIRTHYPSIADTVIDYHNGQTKMLTCKLPKFWSDRISKAYAEMAIGLETSKPDLKVPSNVNEQVKAYADQTEAPTQKRGRGRPKKQTV